MTEEKATYDVAAAQSVIATDKQKRAEECAAEIDALLKKFRCDLTAVVNIGGQNVPVPVQIVAR